MRKEVERPQKPKTKSGRSKKKKIVRKEGRKQKKPSLLNKEGTKKSVLIYKTKGVFGGRNKKRLSEKRGQF